MVMDKPLTFSHAVYLARVLYRDLAFEEKKQTVKYETYGFDKDGMLVSNDKSFSCFYVTPVAKLRQQIHARRKVNVQFFESQDFANLQGMAIRSARSSVDVIVPATASFCIKRFAYTKELIHQWDDLYASKDTSARALMRVIESAMRSLESETVYEPLHIENFCFFCALEIFLPWGKNGEKRSRLLEYRESGLPDLVIAQAYRVPLAVIQFISQSQYLDYSRRVNEAISL